MTKEHTLNVTTMPTEEAEALRECKRVLEAHKIGGEYDWLAERDAALVACEPPYVPLLPDNVFHRFPTLGDQRRTLVAGLESLRKRAFETGGVTMGELCDIIEAERKHANRSDK